MLSFVLPYSIKSASHFYIVSGTGGVRFTGSFLLKAKVESMFLVFRDKFGQYFFISFENSFCLDSIWHSSLPSGQLGRKLFSHHLGLDTSLRCLTYLFHSFNGRYTTSWTVWSDSCPFYTRSHCIHWRSLFSQALVFFNRCNVSEFFITGICFEAVIDMGYLSYIGDFLYSMSTGEYGISKGSGHRTE